MTNFSAIFTELETNEDDNDLLSTFATIKLDLYNVSKIINQTLIYHQEIFEKLTLKRMLLHDYKQNLNLIRYCFQRMFMRRR